MADLQSYAGAGVSPLLVEALLRFQGFDSDAIRTQPVFTGQAHLPWNGGSDGLPISEDHRQARFFRMETLPRSLVVLAELHSLVSLHAGLPDASAELCIGGAPFLTLRRPSYELFKQQIPLLLKLSQLRPQHAAEILTQLRTPEGLWASVSGMRADTHRWTIEFINIALSFTLSALFQLKHQFMCPRPWEYSTQIQPLVQTPGHDSWPSGHATESHLIASLLGVLARGARPHLEEQLDRVAKSISLNREVAGLHFPTDTTAGRVLGSTLARCLVSLGEQESVPKWKTRTFDGPVFYDAGLDFDKDGAAAALDLEQLISQCESDGKAPWSGAAPVAKGLGWIWSRAREEWK